MSLFKTKSIDRKTFCTKLAQAATKLDSLGYNKEAKYLDSVSFKIANKTNKKAEVYNLVNQIIKYADQLDDLKLHKEAGVLTGIATKIAHHWWQNEAGEPMMSPEAIRAEERADSEYEPDDEPNSNYFNEKKFNNPDPDIYDIDDVIDDLYSAWDKFVKINPNFQEYEELILHIAKNKIKKFKKIPRYFNDYFWEIIEDNNLDTNEQEELEQNHLF